MCVSDEMCVGGVGIDLGDEGGERKSGVGGVDEG